MPRQAPRSWVVAVALVAAAAACDDTITGVTPVGGDQPSAAELERFARRLHLDLAGEPASDAFLADAVARLGAGNTADARRALADELLAAPAFAALWIEEVESRAFGGDTMEAQYDLVCSIVRGDDPACQGCAPVVDGDFCGGCACDALDALDAERADLREARADLEGGASTSSIERRYARATPIRALAGPDGAATALFEAFLGLTPEDEPRAAAAAMIQGALLPGAPAGLLFHRHGADLDDLLDILFESEVYREAVVAAVFVRYLGRRPTAAELGHFAGVVGDDDPDTRAVIRAVVSSREYFDQ